MTPTEFYDITESTLENMAKSYGITDLDKYYSLTDFLAFPQLQHLNEIEQTYFQISFHGQNATLISNIVDFEKNYTVLKKILCNFNPFEVLKIYYPDGASRESAEKNLLDAFTNNGISANLNKSNKRPNAIMAGYVSMLLDAACYLKSFKSKQEVVDDLKANYKDIKHLVTYFRNQIKTRFSVALTCDFLKEYSEEFDLPKPDIHIKDALCAYYGKEDNYYRTEKREYECITELQNLVREINIELKKQNRKTITTYQLDRMIWLICSNKFFLDGKEKNSKEFYLSKLK